MRSFGAHCVFAGMAQKLRFPKRAAIHTEMNKASETENIRSVPKEREEAAFIAQAASRQAI